MDIPKRVEFNGVTYALMAGGKYYLSQSKTNAGRKNPKGLHVAIWEYYSGKKVPKGYEIHHKDGNTHNNNFDNLECLSRCEHRKTVKQNKEKCRKHLEEVRPLATEWHRSEEGRAGHREQSRKAYAKREYTEHVCEYCGKTYKTRHTGKNRFCSHNCEIKWRYHNEYELAEGVCQWCGKPFTYKTGTCRKNKVRKFCSKSCSTSHFNAQRRASV